MGYYIQVPENFGKADQIVRLHGARYIDQPTDVLADEVPICVVANPLFEAAGIAYDQNEVDAFRDPYDSRPKQWLALSRDTVLTLNPSAPV